MSEWGGIYSWLRRLFRVRRRLQDWPDLVRRSGWPVAILGAIVLGLLLYETDQRLREKGALVAEVEEAGAEYRAALEQSKAEAHGRRECDTALTACQEAQEKAAKLERKEEQRGVERRVKSGLGKMRRQALNWLDDTPGRLQSGLSLGLQSIRRGSQDAAFVQIHEALQWMPRRWDSFGVEGAAIGLRFSQDGKHLLALSRKGEAVLWHLDGGEGVLLEESPEEYRAMGLIAGKPEHAVIVGRWGGLRIHGPEGLVCREQTQTPADRAAVSTDGTLAALACEARGIVLYSTADCRTVGQIPIGGEVTTVRFSRNGRRLLFVVPGTGIGIWDLEADRLAMAVGREAFVEDVVLDDDGSLVALTDRHGVQVLAVPSGELVDSWQWESDAVDTLFLPGQKVLVAGLGQRLMARDVMAGRTRWEMPLDKPVSRLSVSRGGSRIGVVLDRDHGVILEAASGEQLALLGPRSQLRSLSLSPDGRMAASGASDGMVGIWDLESGPRTVVEPEGGLAETTFVDPAGDRVALQEQGRIRLVDLTRRIGGERILPARVQERLLGFLDGGGALLTARPDGDKGWWLSVLDPATGNEIARHGCPGRAEPEVILRESSPWCGVRSGGESFLLHVRTGETHLAALWPDAEPGISLCHDERVVTYSRADGILEVVELGDRPASRLTVTRPFAEVTVAPGCRYATVRRPGERTELLNLAEGCSVGSVSGVGLDARCLFNPAGTLLAVTDGYETLLHETATGALLQTDLGSQPMFLDSERPVTLFAFDPWGAFLLVGTRAGMWRLGLDNFKFDDVLSWKGVEHFAFSPDGRAFAFRYLHNGVIDVNDVSGGFARGQSFPSLLVHWQEGVAGLRFSADGRRLLVRTANGGVRNWLWERTELAAEACSRLSGNAGQAWFMNFVDGALAHLECPNQPGLWEWREPQMSIWR